MDGHHHEHGHIQTDDSRRLVAALALILGFMVAEVVVGLLASSLALLDAAHMLTDAAATAGAVRGADRHAPAQRRLHVRLSPSRDPVGQPNGATPWALGLLIGVEGMRRLADRRRRGPRGARGGGGGHRGEPGRHADARRREPAEPERGGRVPARANDLFAFVATAIAGALILIAGFSRADGIAALLVAALMLSRRLRLLRDSGRVLLEAAPRDLDPPRSATRSRPSTTWSRSTTSTSGRSARLPRDVRARDRCARLRHPVAPSPARRAAERALRDHALDPSRWRPSTRVRSRSSRCDRAAGASERRDHEPRQAAVPR